MKLLRVLQVVSIVILLVSSGVGYVEELELTEELRTEIIKEVIAQLETGYVLPERGLIAVAELQHRLDTGYFGGVSDPQVFANRITGVMDVISDWHLWVNYHADPIPESFVSGQFTDEEERKVYLRRRNFGFERVERLVGNLGYIELREFHYEAGASEKALADVMNLVRFTDGLIIDLRRNGGGAPEMVALFAGVHLGDIRYKDEERVVQSFTQPEVSGAHYGLNRPVTLLLSDNTFSGAEAFSYTMQVLERVTLVGERTRGGAHLFEDVRLHEHFMMALPIGRSVNPITQTSWQYVGVRPDHGVPAQEALHQAQKLMLEGLLTHSTDKITRAEQEFALRLLGQ